MSSQQCVMQTHAGDQTVDTMAVHVKEPANENTPTGVFQPPSITPGEWHRYSTTAERSQYCLDSPHHTTDGWCGRNVLDEDMFDMDWCSAAPLLSSFDVDMEPFVTPPEWSLDNHLSV